MALLKLIFIGALLFSSVACTNLFFQPTRTVYPSAWAEHLQFDQLKFKSADGTQLAAWYFPSQKNRELKPEFIHWKGTTRGLVMQFHGNGQNMTAHYSNLAWLLFEGYDLMTFDYRGYGTSEGETDLDGINADARTAVDLAQAKATAEHLPLILYGQSLGGSLLLRALEDLPHPSQLKMVVIESSFYSYQQVARETLSHTWITWPIQWLAYILVSDRYSPGSKRLSSISPIPVLLIYSKKDPVVGISEGERIFAELTQPKEFWRHPNPGHINAMFVENGRYRQQLVADFTRLLAPGSASR